MNRIDQKFKTLKKTGQTAFIPYITCGYPDLESTKKMVLGMEKIGADIIELGVPFSDPLADGPVIQESSQKALDKGISLAKIMDFVASLRRLTQVPIVLMSYYNPINSYGDKKFVLDAKMIGVDGLVIPDLPLGEGKDLSNLCRKNNIDLIFLLSPTSNAARAKQIAAYSTGYIYYLSLTGVTGVRKNLPENIESGIKNIRRISSKPLCVGFGISTPQQVKFIKKFADGIIVGSAIIKIMEKNINTDPVGKAIRFTKKLIDAR